MKVLLLTLLICSLAFVCRGQEIEDDKKDAEEESSWWSSFKTQVKTVLVKWRDDLKSLWDQVLSKASDMRSWTSNMFDSFKLKMKEWIESRTDVPEDEKNEIETFISKLRLPTEEPKEINP